MPKKSFKTGKIRAAEVSELDLDFAIDTALSWDGRFPDPGPGDYLVTVGAYDREPEHVLVSRRYVSATGPDNAAEIALSAFAERHSYAQDDEGNVLPITVKDTTGVPVWIERVDAVTK